MERTESAMDGAGPTPSSGHAQPHEPEAAIAEMERLLGAHRQLEQRLREIDRHLALTSAERLERAQLKKEKLRLKDRMLLLKTRERA